MRQPFWVAYLAAALLLLIAFWVVGLATESFEFATVCYIWSAVGLLASYLQSHSNSPVIRGVGALLWLVGLLGIMGTLGGSWQAAVASGASGDLAWLMIIAMVAVIVVYLVGRWWGEFYAALSFIVVPVLSIFGLSIPMVASIEIVFAIIASLVLGVFLVSVESLLIRWRKGQLGGVTPSLLLSYCWRLSVTGSAMVLTVGLLLVPPATFIHGPLSQQLLRFPVLPFARYNYGAVDFPDLFTMPGGPLALPEVELFRVRGTDYPRWRVRTYVYYVGSGWRVSNEIENPQLPILRTDGKFLEMVWRPQSKSPSKPIEASVSATGQRVVALLSPGEALKLRVSALARSIVLRTKSGCLQPVAPLNIVAYNITAIPIPEDLPPRSNVSLSPEERKVLSYFPPYLYRVRELAFQVTQNADTPYEKAKALETFLRTQYRYSDSPPYLVGHNVDVVTFFLFEAKEGACDWFASALALMCRAVGIPTRVVTGFYSDEVDTDGSLVIRASDAHAWVEAFIDGHGWVTLDATPSGDRNRSNLWLALQRWLSRRYRASFANPYMIWWFVALLWFLGAVPTMLKLSLRAWEHYRPRPKWQTVVRCYLTAVQIARKAGLNLRPNATPWENAEICEKTPRFPVAGKKAFRELADLTVAVLYAGEEPNRADVKRARRLLKTFRQQALLYKRWFAPARLRLISLQTLRQIWERI